MIWRKRGSRAKADRIEAVQWPGFQALPRAHHDHPAMPDWLPPVTAHLVDALDQYDQVDDSLETLPEGEAARFGPNLMLPVDGKNVIVKPGDYLVHYPDGRVAGMAADELHKTYTMMT